MDASAQTETDSRQHPLNRLGRLSLFFRNRLERQSLLVSQPDECSVPGWQRLPATPQRCHIRIRIVVTSGGFGTQPFGESFAIACQSAIFTTGSPQFFSQAIAGHRANPGTEVRSGRVLIEVEVRVNKYLLNEVFRGVAVAQKDSRNAPDGLLVQAYQFCERLSIPGEHF